jgi:hypothetical protein
VTVCATRLPPLGAGNTGSGSIRLCPICDDGNQCNGVETCDPNANDRRQRLHSGHADHLQRQ